MTMPISSTYRVFVSYTARDLEAHADIVSDVIRRLEWITIDHKYWSPSGRPSVAECMEQVESCHILVVLVAHRYGWVPSKEEGGDGVKSITWLEVDHARELGLEVIPFLVEEDALWPPNLIEGVGNREVQDRLNQFKSQLSKSLCSFFSTPLTLQGQLAIALPRTQKKIQERRQQQAFPMGITTGPTADETVVPFYFDPDHPPSLSERIETQLPKRILAIDDGGVRSGLALPFLERIERLLQIRYGALEFRLRDYFDIIGGTGLAPLIAVELARGKAMSQLKPILRQAVDTFYTKSFWRMIRFQHVYNDSHVAELLEEFYGQRQIDDAEFGTCICVVATNLENGEIHPFTNHPQVSMCGDLLIRDVLQASLALPTLLPPHPLYLQGEEPSPFVSGQLSTGQDPSLYLFLVATAPEFPFQWRRGKRRLFLLSIGSGTWPGAHTNLGDRPNMLRMLPVIISQMSAGVRYQSRALFSSLAGNGEEEGTSGVLSYRRFNVEFSEQHFDELGLAALKNSINELQIMDRPDNFGDLLTIGERSAERNIAPDLFLPSFDVRRPAE